MTISIQPLAQSHVSLLLKWLSNNAVLEFYSGRDQVYTIEKVTSEFFPEDDSNFRYIAYYNNNPIGYVQFYCLDDDAYKQFGFLDEIVFGMDQFIGEPALWNKGIGTLLVNYVVAYIETHHRPHYIVMDPQVRNKRSIRCYEKCGFTTIKLLPKQEWHEGKLEDCFLMVYNTKQSDKP